MIPVVITLVLYVYLIRFLQTQAQDLLSEWLITWGLNPENWIAILISWTVQLVLLLVSALTFTFSSSIVASPFNDLLAEKSEKHTTPQLPPVTHKSFKQQIKLVGIDLFKTIAATFAGIFAILFSWVPILNIVSFTIAFLLVTFQYTSYPQTRRGISLKSGTVFLWRHLFACIGFGSAISFFYAIPFISSLALPIAVVGGTLLVAKASDQAGPYPLK